jgi:hypothetical protein
VGPDTITTRDQPFLFALTEQRSQLYCLVLRKSKGLGDPFERIGIIFSYIGGVKRSEFGEENLYKEDEY